MVAKRNWLWLLLAVIGLYAMGSYGLRHLVILPSFAALEKAEAAKDISRIVDAIHREAYHIGKKSSDWAIWDDTYQFLQDHNEDYIESNILPLENFEESVGVNLLYICDTAGRVVFGEVFDNAQGGRLTLQEFPRDALRATHFLLQHSATVGVSTGVMLTEGGPLLVGSSPVLASSGEGPSSGTLIMGHFLDRELLESLQQQTQVQFRIQQVEKGSQDPEVTALLTQLSRLPVVIRENGPEFLQAYGVINDLQGQPALLIVAQLPRTIMAKGLEAAKYASFSVLASAIALVVISSILVLMVINLHRESSVGYQGGFWRPREILVLAMVVLAGLILSCGVCLTVYNVEEAHLRTIFQERSVERYLLFRNRMDHYLAELKGLQRFFASSKDVSRQDFRNFILPLLQEHPDIQALEWFPRIFADQRRAHEEALHVAGVPDYQITEPNDEGVPVRAGHRDVYYPVAYVEPLVGNEAALGFAPGEALPTRLEAIERARDTGQLAVTASFSLIQGKNTESGCLVLAPVYRQHSRLRDLEQRRLDLVGFATAVFRIGSLFEPAIADSPDGGIDLAIYDQTDPHREQLLYFHPSRTRTESMDEAEVADLRQRAAFSNVFQLELGGRRWALVSMPAPQFLQPHHHWQSSLVLVGSLLVTAWLVSYLVGNRRRAAYTETIVAERTAELQRSEMKFRNVFQSIQDIYVETSWPEGRILEVSPSVEALSGYRREDLIGSLTSEFYAR
ncbi:MAG: CHASE domain-containing protein, partial [Desulfuromonadaceae bacterium]